MPARRRLPLLPVLLAIATLSCASSHARLRRLGSPSSGGIAILRVVLDANLTPDPSTDAMVRDLTTGIMRIPDSGTISEASIANVDSEGVRAEAFPISGLLVFSDLQAGTYELRSLAHPRFLLDRSPRLGGNRDFFCARREFRLEASDAPRFTIGPGDLVYIGRLALSADYRAAVIDDSEPSPAFELRGVALGPRPGGRAADWESSERASWTLDRTRSEELEAWKALLQGAPSMAWADLIRERITELETPPVANAQSPEPASP
jgi:hypothetical protein